MNIEARKFIPCSPFGAFGSSTSYIVAGAGTDRLAGLLVGTVPHFDGLHGVFERPFQDASADRAEHKAEHPSLDVLAVGHDNHVNVGSAVGPTGKGLGVA